MTGRTHSLTTQHNGVMTMEMVLEATNQEIMLTIVLVIQEHQPKTGLDARIETMTATRMLETHSRMTQPSGKIEMETIGETTLMETTLISSLMMQVNGRILMVTVEGTTLAEIMEIDSPQTLLNGTIQTVMAMETIKMEMSRTFALNPMENPTILLQEAALIRMLME